MSFQIFFIVNKKDSFFSDALIMNKLDSLFSDFWIVNKNDFVFSDSEFAKQRFSVFRFWIVKKNWTTKDLRRKKKWKKEKKRGLKEGNEKSNFQNPEGIVLRRRWIFPDVEVTLDNSEKN
jgi:hypothetical protein